MAHTRGAFLAGAARLGALAALGGAGRALDAAAAAAGVERRGVHEFVTRPDLRPPVLTVTGRGPASEGLLFLAPSSGPGQRGTLIAAPGGDPVWFHPTAPRTAMNFRRSLYRGRPVLTWWEGKTTNGLGRGTHVVLDDEYRVVARIPAGDGRESDLHEFVITPHDTALVTSYEVRNADISPAGGPGDFPAIGGIVQELELPSGRVLFEWRSLDHVAIAETHTVFDGHPLDYFHVNSIDLAPDGDLLVSARNTWAVYKVSRRTGRVVWRLGGRRSDFAMGRGTVFAWQHDARLHPGGLLTVFDDGAEPQVEPQSRGLLIALDEQRRRARLVRKYTHRPGRIVTRYMGNVQLLPDGDVVVGWGSERFLTEFAADGRIVLDARLPRGAQNYRAFRFPWSGRPRTRPTLAARRLAAHTLCASWNGATEVVAWHLEAGRSVATVRASGTVARDGFETEMQAPPGTRVARVVALDMHGHPLGTSEAIRVRP